MPLRHQVGLGEALNSPFVCSALIAAPMSYFELNRNRFRKSLNVNLPDALVTSLPKLLLAFVHWRSENSARGNCWVVALANRVLDAGRARQQVDAELRHRAAVHFGEADAEQHLVARRPVANLEQREHFFFLVHVAGGEVHGLSMTSLFETRPDRTTFLPLLSALIDSPGSSCPIWSVSRVRIALDG